MTDLSVDLDPAAYLVKGSDLLTPALAIYPAVVRHNIGRIISLLDGQPNRWRPHLKTVKLSAVMKLLVEAGVTTAKVATTLELLAACQSGFHDVLVAYPHMGRTAERIAAIASEFPSVRVSAVVESEEQIREFAGTPAKTPVDLFIDVDPGMNRTGVDPECPGRIERLAVQIGDAGLKFRGLHFYDGNSTEEDLALRTEAAHARYDGLLKIVSEIESAGVRVEEVITSGTPALPCSLSYQGLWSASFKHQVSPGTVVYCDASSLKQLPESYGLRPAVLVVAQVVSRPKANVITCDAGHKSVSVDSGVPNCVVLGKPELTPLKPSEEHLPISTTDPSSAPPLGSYLYLIPRHVCPTVNNFDFAAMVNQPSRISTERVTARGREGPI